MTENRILMSHFVLELTDCFKERLAFDISDGSAEMCIRDRKYTEIIRRYKKMGNIPLWLCIPFAGLLLCIAIFPLVKGEWWDKNKGWAVLIWSLLFMIPFAVKYGAGETAETVLECIVNDYLSFICLLYTSSFLMCQKDTTIQSQNLFR